MYAPRTDLLNVWHMLTSSWINLMLVALPVGLWAGHAGADPTLVFVAVRGWGRGGCVCGGGGGGGAWR